MNWHDVMVGALGILGGAILIVGMDAWCRSSLNRECARVHRILHGIREDGAHVPN